MAEHNTLAQLLAVCRAWAWLPEPTRMALAEAAKQDPTGIIRSVTLADLVPALQFLCEAGDISTVAGDWYTVVDDWAYAVQTGQLEHRDEAAIRY
ncbi:MAG: hypothetical protein KKA73_18380 [Chloroflexi bacterium]|nr:hypothetical protein [Chloroflexota bacterium]MBU1749655.1 hypothetical protein [Chloroflexota bacterium]